MSFPHQPKTVQKLFVIQESRFLSSYNLFWLILSISLSISFAAPALIKALGGEYLAMDDARQHLFWMQRFVDPELFPGDLIADFYQSVAPPGVSGTYWLMNQIGIDPLLLNKFLPMILGAMTTVYCFMICTTILPLPVVGFVGSLLLNQSLWLHGELVTATGTGFLYPTFLAFLYYLLRRSRWGVGLSLMVLGLCYAPLLLVAAGILSLRLIDWRGGRSVKDWLVRDRNEWILFGTGLGITLGIVLLYAFQSSEFGPTVTASEARTMPEFLDNGRTAFYYQNSFWKFWFKNSRSGLRLSLNPPLVILGLFLPVLLRFSQQFSLAKQVNQRVEILWQLLFSSLGLFILAHGILFKLYLPSRYTSHSLRIILSISTALTLALVLDTTFRRWRSSVFPILLTLVLGSTLLFYPKLVWKSAFPRAHYFIGAESGIYMFLQNQPKDTVVASLAIEADNLPMFSQRSVLVSWEHAIPYKMGYYRQIRQRARDLIQAHYSSDLKQIQDFVDTYDVDFFLLERDAFETEYMTENSWFLQWSDLAQQVTDTLNSDQRPILQQRSDQCNIFETPNLVMLDAQCVAGTDGTQS
ncbi:MAG: hypothetical protein ACFBSC_08455 [Microcoleaceae cyanobacterium]